MHTEDDLTIRIISARVVMVTLAPDVAAAFPDADAVNEALRVLLKAAKKASKPRGRSGEKAA